MEIAIAFAAGMLLTLVALALEDWTRVSKWRKATLPPDEGFGAARMLFSGQGNPAASGQQGHSQSERMPHTRRVA